GPPADAGRPGRRACWGQAADGLSGPPEGPTPPRKDRAMPLTFARPRRALTVARALAAAATTAALAGLSLPAPSAPAPPACPAAPAPARLAARNGDGVACCVVDRSAVRQTALTENQAGVSLVVVDGCGGWSQFVGGGAAAF